jgi:predicted O-methyltransferase YrrM
MKPGNFAVMTRKVVRRLMNTRGELSPEENRRWLQANAAEFVPFAKRIDAALLVESLAYAENLKAHAEKVLATIPYDLHGSGFYTLLYFLARLRKPETTLETGVAAGWSSHAFLSAILRNGTGRPSSSEFPYFRIPNSERLVGVLVEPHMKPHWILETRGDAANLPKMLSGIHSVNLFHYDSDKSYEGRRFALDLVRPKLAPDALIVMDDLQDNAFFHDVVKGMPQGKWSVFRRGKSFVGVVGEIT